MVFWRVLHYIFYSQNVYLIFVLSVGKDKIFSLYGAKGSIAVGTYHIVQEKPTILV